MELLQEAEFWVGIALVIFVGILVWVKVPGMAMKALDAQAEQIRAELAEAERLRKEAEARVRLEEQIKRRAEIATHKIAQAEAQAAADVKAAAAELAADMAALVLARRVAGMTSDPLVDRAIGELASKLQ